MQGRNRGIVYLVPVGVALLSAGCSHSTAEAPAPGQPSGYVQEKLNNSSVPASDKEKMRAAMEASKNK